MDSELSRGCGSKFPTRGSNRMLVAYCVNFNYFIVDSVYLEDS